MKRYIRLVVLFCVPLLFFFYLKYLTDIRGPNWIMVPDDFTYGYLLKAVNLLEGKSLLTLSHPGIPIICMDAGIVQTIFILRGGGDLVHDVIENAELYTFIINYFYVILNVAALFVMGIAAYRATRKLWLSILIQFAPFLWRPFWHGLINSGLPETLQLFCGLLLVAAIMSAWKSRLASRREIWKFILASAAICALGTATKSIFIPLCLLPLLLVPGYRYKAAYLISVVIFFFLFMLPVAGYLDNIFKYHRAMFIGQIRAEHLARGGTGVQDLFLAGFKFFKQAVPAYMLVVAISLGFWLVTMAVPKFRRALRAHYEYRILACANVVLVLSLLLVATRPNGHYLFHCAGPAALSLIACLSLVAATSRPGKIVAVALSLVAAVAVVQYQIPALKSDSRFFRYIKDDALNINEKIANQYNQGAVIYAIAASNRYTALEHANQNNSMVYCEALARIIPSNVYFYRLDGKSYYDRARGSLRITDILARHKQAVFTTAGLEAKTKSSWYAKPEGVVLFCTYNGKGTVEQIYEVKEVLFGVVTPEEKRNKELDRPLLPPGNLNSSPWTAKGDLPQLLDFDFHSVDLPGGTITKYVLGATATEVAERMPRSWQLLGSNDGTRWHVLDIRTDEPDWQAGQTREYNVKEPRKYRRYRLEIVEGASAAEVKLSEFTLVANPDGLEDNGRVLGIMLTGAKGRFVVGFWEEVGSFPRCLRADLGLIGPKEITAYVLGTGNDGPEAPGRMPKDWELQGSNDGKSWEVIDRQQGETDWEMNEKRRYEVACPDSYLYYQLRVDVANDPNVVRLYTLDFFSNPAGKVTQGDHGGS